MTPELQERIAERINEKIIRRRIVPDVISQNRCIGYINALQWVLAQAAELEPATITEDTQAVIGNEPTRTL